MVRTGRPKTERQTVKSTFIRLTDEELKVIDEFLGRQSTGVIGGEKITVAAFGRALMLREALEPLVRAVLPTYRHEIFNVSDLVRDLKLSSAMRIPVLSLLRGMASAGELMQHSADDFFVPVRSDLIETEMADGQYPLASTGGILTVEKKYATKLRVPWRQSREERHKLQGAAEKAAQALLDCEVETGLWVRDGAWSDAPLRRAAQSE